MACACGKKAAAKTTYTWRSADGTQTKVYKTEQEARWKQQRDGGTYTPKP